MEAFKGPARAQSAAVGDRRSVAVELAARQVEEGHPPNPANVGIR